MSKRRIIIRIPSGGAPPTPASTTGVGGSGGSSASPKRARIGDSGVGTTPALIQASIAVAGMEYWGGKGMGGCGVGGGGSPLPLATSIAEETGEGRAGGYSGGKRSTATSGSTSTAEVDPEVVGGEITLRFTNNTNTPTTVGVFVASTRSDFGPICGGWKQTAANRYWAVRSLRSICVDSTSSSYEFEFQTV